MIGFSCLELFLIKEEKQVRYHNITKIGHLQPFVKFSIDVFIYREIHFGDRMSGSRLLKLFRQSDKETFNTN